MMRLTIGPLMIAVGLAMAGCCVDGSGDLVTEQRDVDGFSSIDVDGPGDVVIRRSDTFKVSVRTDDNIIDDIKTTVRNNTLHIDRKDGHRCVNPTVLTLTVSMPELRNISIDGTAEVRIEDGFDSETMKISIDGTGDVVGESLLIADTLNVRIDGTGDAALEVDANLLTTKIDGTGGVKYTGVAVEHRITINGTGDVKAFGLETEVTDVDIDGTGSCQVSVSDTLDVNIDGLGGVRYKGDASVTQRIDGIGDVKDAN